MSILFYISVFVLIVNTASQQVNIDYTEFKSFIWSYHETTKYSLYNIIRNTGTKVNAEGPSVPENIASNATVGGITYFFSKPLQWKTWSEADALCKQYNTFLATVATNASNTQLLQAWNDAGKPPYAMWIGLQSQEKNKFTWIRNNEPMVWSNWYRLTGPVAIDSMKCVAANFGILGNLGKWTNNLCSNRIGFICTT